MNPVFNTITYEVSDRIASITLNRPEKRNALNFVVVKELKEALVFAESSPDVKVIILKANGKAFCSGADLEYVVRLQEYGYDENLIDSTHLMELYQKIYRMGKVVIAQIQGHALAGGCGLVTVCDFSFSVPEAKFGYTEVHIGFIPAIVMVFLIRKLGEARAKEMLLTGDLVSAHKAHSIGIINDVLPIETIENDVRNFALKLCKENSGASMELTKKMMADVQDLPIDDALLFAAKMNARSRATEDCRRGMSNFLQKLPLEW